MAINIDINSEFAKADALSYEFTMTFGMSSFGIVTGDMSSKNSQDEFSQRKTYRIKSCTIPDWELGVYEANMGSKTITKLDGTIKTPTTFSFTFRIDNEWLMYNDMWTWLKKFYNPSFGAVSSDYLLGNVAIQDICVFIDRSTRKHAPEDFLIYNGTKRQDKGKFPGWLFWACTPVKLSGVSFDNSTGDPLEAEMTVKCLKIEPLSFWYAS